MNNTSAIKAKNNAIEVESIGKNNIDIRKSTAKVSISGFGLILRVVLFSSLIFFIFPI